MPCPCRNASLNGEVTGDWITEGHMRHPQISAD